MFKVLISHPKNDNDSLIMEMVSSPIRKHSFIYPTVFTFAGEHYTVKGAIHFERGPDGDDEYFLLKECFFSSRNFYDIVIGYKEYFWSNNDPFSY